MSLKLLEWISLLADLVTVLGITGFFTSWLLNRRNTKQITYDILHRSFQDALITTNVLSLEEYFLEESSFNSLIVMLDSVKEALYIETDEFFKENMEEYHSQLSLEEIESLMDNSITPQELELEPSMYIYYTFDKEKLNDKIIYKNIEIWSWSDEELKEHIEMFKKSSEQEKEVIIDEMIEINIEYLFYYLGTFRNNDLITDLKFKEILEKSIKNISENTMNKYLAEELIYIKKEVYSIINKLDEYTINYRHLARKEIDELIQKDGHPYEYIESSNKKSSKLIPFDTNNYIKQKILAIENFVYFLERLKINYSKYVTEERHSL